MQIRKQIRDAKTTGIAEMTRYDTHIPARKEFNTHLKLARECFEDADARKVAPDCDDSMSSVFLDIVEFENMKTSVQEEIKNRLKEVNKSTESIGLNPDNEE